MKNNTSIQVLEIDKEDGKIQSNKAVLSNEEVTKQINNGQIKGTKILLVLNGMNDGKIILCLQNESLNNNLQNMVHFLALSLSRDQDNNSSFSRDSNDDTSTNNETMTEPQRRFLFRLLAEKKNLKGELAEDHLSATQIQSYLDCSLKYKFNYIDKLPRPFKPSGLALGSAIHAVVDWLHKKWKEGKEISLETLWQIFENDWYAQAMSEIKYRNGEKEEDVLNTGRGLLNVYLNHVERDCILKSEMSFEVPIVDITNGESLEIPLVGVFDKVEKGDVVADLKTWGRMVSFEDLESNIQLSAYGYAYRIMYHKDPQLRLDILLKTKAPRFEQLTTERQEMDHLIFFNLCREIYKSIQKKVFLPNPSWKCRDCEFKQHCWFWDGKDF